MRGKKDTANAKTWTGGAHWHWRGKVPWSKDHVWRIRHAGWPLVKLRLDDEGGVLLYAKSDGPEVAFAWREVEGIERVRVFGLPFLGEGARFTLEEVIAGVPRRLLFFSASKGRTMDILRFAESRGVKVERRAKNRLTVP